MQYKQTNKKRWIKAYADLVQYGDLTRDPYLSLQQRLLAMTRNAQKYARTCVTDNNNMLDTNTESGISFAPCGKIHVQGALETPITFSWAVRVWKNFKINTSVARIDVPYSDRACSVNYLHLYDEMTPEGNIARLCGRSSGKIFYSKTSSVDIKLTLEFAKPDTNKILSMAYQVLSKFTLRSLLLHPKVESEFLQSFYGQTSSDLHFNVQHLYIRMNNVEMNVFYYNTYIWKQLKAIIHGENCSATRVLAYDGPSSKYKLLGDLQLQDAVIFSSFLYILSIYIMQQPSVFPAAVCYNITVSSIEHPIQTQNLNIISMEKIHFEAASVNTLKVIYIEVPEDKFINIKMTNFEYTGNTEAGCFLGGVVIHDDGKPKLGPLCGEYGRLIFEDDRLGGLSLSSNIAVIYIFLFSEENASILLDMIIASDECEGIPNPKEIFMERRYVGKHIEYWHSWININYGRVLLKISPKITCVKIQNFHDAISDKSCYVMVSDLTQDVSNLYKAELIVASRTSLDATFFSTKPYAIILHTYNVELNRNIHTPESPTNASIVKEPYTANLFSFDMVHSTYWAAKYDGVTAIVFQFEQKRECFQDEVFASNSYLRRPADGIKCSSLNVTLSNAVFFTDVLWPDLRGTDSSNQMTIDFSRLSKNNCSEGEIYFVIKLISDENYAMNFNISLFWMLKYDKIQWKLWGIASLTRVEIYAAVNLHILSQNTDILDYLDILSNDRHHGINSSCEITFKVMHKLEESNEDQHQLYGSANSSDGTFCLFSTCYMPYMRINASWNSADIFCQRRNQQLLTINSDIKAKFIQEVISTDFNIYYSPVIFLNMKQDEQVCITSC